MLCVGSWYKQIQSNVVRFAVEENHKLPQNTILDELTFFSRSNYKITFKQ